MTTWAFGVLRTKYWTILPWIATCPCKCGSWRFTWLFIELQKEVIVKKS
jgi:hypothetical protein